MKMLKDKNERIIAGVCGQNIKKLRENANYSQEKLAQLLECSEETIGKVERGIQMMKFWRLIRLCEMFHVSLDYIVRDYDPTNLEKIPSYVVKLYQDADESDLEVLNRHVDLASDMLDLIHAGREP